MTTRRYFDITMTAAALVAMVIMLILSSHLQGQADFAVDTVKTNLAEQKISFGTLDALTPDEKLDKALVAQAGKKVLTGYQAKIFANNYIADHLATSTRKVATDPASARTYSELSSESRAASAANSGVSAADATKLKALVETAFKGETLRGILLTTYGFSQLGEQAQLAADWTKIGAVALILIGIAFALDGIFLGGAKKEKVASSSSVA